MIGKPIDFWALGSFEEYATMEMDRLRKRAEQLESGPGGIMEMKQTIADKEKEIERLKEKCDKQAMILRRLTPDQHPNTLFISGILGALDQNGMPKKICVVPAYGVDFSYVYEYNGTNIVQEW